MANNIDSSTQLSTFDFLKGLFKANSTLSKVFRDKDYYQFEPNLKNTGTKLPHMIIKIPNTDTEAVNLDYTQTEKNFTVIILVKEDYSARDKVEAHNNAIIATIEGAQDTFETNSYFRVKIDLNDSDDEIEDSKQIILSQFTLTFTAPVGR